MAEEEVYTEGRQNGLRLAACLVELGTRAVKQVFQRYLNDSHTSLNNILRKKEQKLRKSGFFKRQLELMFPKGKQPCLDDFDVTLLYKLLGILFNVQVPQLDQDGTPQPGDASENADLYRIKLIRNTIYGHISTMSMSGDEFNRTWNYLKLVLVRLNIASEECEKYKHNNFEPQKADHYIEQMKCIMMQDLESMETMFIQYRNDLDKALKNQNEKFRHEFKESFNEFKTELDKSMQNKNFKFCEIAFQRLAEEKEAKVVIHQTLQNSIQGIEQSFIEVKEKLDDIDQKQNHIEELVKQQPKEKLSVLRSTSVTNTEYLDELKVDSFKILLTNESNMEESNKAELELLGKGLGCVPWNVVLDLDHYSRRKNGLFDKVTKFLKKHKEFKVATYKKVVALPDSDKEHIASDAAALWILANGCPDIKCDPSADKFQKAKIPIITLLTSIISKLQIGRPVLCMAVLRSSKCVAQAQILLQALTEILLAADEIVSEKNCSFVIINLDEKVPPIALETEAKVTPINCLPRSFSKNLLENFQDSLEEKQYKIPSKTGPVFLTKEELIPFDPTVEVFHEDVGKIDYKRLGKKTEKVTKEICLSYHKGNAITAEALFINPKFKVYIERTEIRTVTDKIKLKIEKPNKGELKHRLVIYHDASGGGSTVARVALYSFRKIYPCVLVKQITENFQLALRKIYDVSKMPLLVLFDDVDVTDEEMESILQMIRKGRIKALLIKTERFMSIPSKKEKYNTPDSVYVSGTLAEEDKPAFRALYSQYKKMILDSDRVFLYGLQAFLSEHKRFTLHITHCLDHVIPEQKLLLRFACMYWYYCNCFVPIHLVIKILKLPPEKAYGETLIEGLGYALDLLTQKGNGVKPVHACIISPLMDIANDSNTTLSHIRCFLSDIAYIFDSCLSVDQQEIVTNVAYHIFIKRKRKEDWWSPLIQDIYNHIHALEINQTYIEFIKLLEKTTIAPHFRSLYARYLMHIDKNPNASVQQMRLAIGLKDDQGVVHSHVKDSSLLITYGNLIRERASRCSHHHDTTVTNFENLKADVEESVLAFKKAQKNKKAGDYIRSGNSSKIDVRSFVGEAKARILMLDIIFRQKSNTQTKQYLKYIQSTSDNFIRSCESEAIRVIEQMEYYRQYNLLYDDSPTQSVKDTSKIKLDLLYLRSEYPRGGDVQKHIKSMDVNIFCDVGLYMRYNLDGPTTQWKNFRKDDLVFIITEIKRRLEAKQKTKERCLKCNYQDIITAMIYLSHMIQTSEEQAEDSLFNDALILAKEWERNFADDHVPHFMVGLLYFVKGLDEKDKTLFREAEKCRDKCISICEKYKTMFGFSTEHYFLGNSKGLAKIIPNELDYKELGIFEGRQLKKDKAIVHLGDKMDVVETKFKQLPGQISKPQQEQLVYFNLGFSFDGLQAKETTIPEHWEMLPYMYH